MLCKEPDFQAYAFKVFPIMDGVSEDNASTYLRTACKIDSRSELATNPDAAEAFRDIRVAFEQWLSGGKR
jgi:hypothetical protein